jgi:hypothetical protein
MNRSAMDSGKGRSSLSDERGDEPDYDPVPADWGSSAPRPWG